MRLLWPVNGSQRLRVGLNGFVFASDGSKPTTFIGPMIEAAVSKTVNLRLSLTEGIGALKGQRLRFEAVFSGF